MRRLVVVVLVGCGRLGFAPLDDASAAFDAPFSPPQRLAELSTSADDDDPSLTADLLELYFSSTITGADSLYRSTRARVTDAWSAPELVTEINMGGSCNNPKVTLDGLAIYFSSGRMPNTGVADLWVSTRPDRGSSWSVPTKVTELSTSDNDYEPYVLPDHRTIYFTRSPLGEPSILRATRAAPTDSFGPPVLEASLDQPGYDGGAWTTPDELGVMFQSYRGTDGNKTIYRATRAAASDPFSTPTQIIELDMVGNEEDPWLSPDGHTLYFASNVTGDIDIYFATR